MICIIISNYSSMKIKSATVKTLLFIPNIVDYVRIILLTASGFYYYSNPAVFLLLYISSACLDGVDGFLARKLNQVSAFGAWLDVVVDNFGRSMVWCRTSTFGFAVTSLEWTTFVCNHTQGQQWKSKVVGPHFVQKVMQNNFKTPLGLLAIGSLNVLPLWLYCLQNNVLIILYLPVTVCHVITAILVIGRLVCAAVEIWCVSLHVMYLCQTNEKT